MFRLTPTRCVLACAVAVVVSVLYVSRKNLYHVLVRAAHFLADIVWRWIIDYVRHAFWWAFEWFERLVPLQLYTALVWSGCVDAEQYSFEFFRLFFYTVHIASFVLFSMVAAPPRWLFWRASGPRAWPFGIGAICVIKMTMSISRTLAEWGFEQSALLIHVFTIVQLIFATFVILPRIGQDWADLCGWLSSKIEFESATPAEPTVSRTSLRR